jgi:hypothetical protein
LRAIFFVFFFKHLNTKTKSSKLNQLKNNQNKEIKLKNKKSENKSSDKKIKLKAIPTPGFYGQNYRRLVLLSI